MAGPAFINNSIDKSGPSQPLSEPIDNSIDKSGPSQPLTEPIDNSIDNSGSQGLGNTTGPLQGHYRATTGLMRYIYRPYTAFTKSEFCCSKEKVV
jgi:hypothetical protein